MPDQGPLVHLSCLSFFTFLLFCLFLLLKVGLAAIFASRSKCSCDMHLVKNAESVQASTLNFISIPFSDVRCGNTVAKPF
jgi:hypothetical protein